MRKRYRSDTLATMLRNKVELWGNVLSPEDVRDATGARYPVETKLRELWAEIRPQTGSLLSGRAAETQLSKTTHKITIRYRAEIKPDMWFVAGGVRYEILYILDPYVEHERQEVFCEVSI